MWEDAGSPHRQHRAAGRNPGGGRAGRAGGRQAHFPRAGRQTGREVRAAVEVPKQPAQATESTVFSVVLASAYQGKGRKMEPVASWQPFGVLLSWVQGKQAQIRIYEGVGAERLRGLRNITCEKTSQDQERPWGSTHSYQQLKQKGEGKREPVNGLKMGIQFCRTPKSLLALAQLPGIPCGAKARNGPGTPAPARSPLRLVQPPPTRYVGPQTHRHHGGCS